MTFCVLVPTIRRHLPGFDETMATVEASFTLPTEFHIVDGHGGKVPALNRAFDEVLWATSADVYVTLDDDYLIEPGWQDDLVAAFVALPKAGIVAPYFGDDAESQRLMGPDSYEEWQSIAEIRVRKLKKHRHIPGGMLAFRKEVALAIGKQPTTGIAYEVYEDAWRGRMAQKLGWDAYYVATRVPRLIEYDDDPAYVEQKQKDIDESRRIMHDLMGKDGVADPWSWRLRRWIAKIRGRAV